MPTNIEQYALAAGQSGARFRSVYLQGSEDAPPYAALEIIGRAWNGGIIVRKPQSSDMGPHRVLFAGDVGIKASSWGVATNTWPVLALYGSSIEISNRERLGTVSGQWGLRRGFEGFFAIGQIEGQKSGDALISVVPDVLCRDSTTGSYGFYGYPPPVGATCFCCSCKRFQAQGYPNYTINFPTSLIGTLTVGCLGTISVPLTKVAADWHGCQVTTGGDSIVVSTAIAYIGQYRYGFDGEPQEFGCTQCSTGFHILFSQKVGIAVDILVACVFTIATPGPPGQLLYACEEREHVGGVGDSDWYAHASWQDTTGLTCKYVDWNLYQLGVSSCQPFHLYRSGNVECVFPSGGIGRCTTGYVPCSGSFQSIDIVEA